MLLPVSLAPRSSCTSTRRALSSPRLSSPLPSMSVASPAPAVAPASAPAEAPAKPDAVHVRVEFSGGLELLFNRVKSLPLSFTPSPSHPAESLTVRFLIAHLAQHYCTERQELFVADDSVRPGILVLINDTDWELEDGLDYRMRDGDVIVFISTLHGG